MASSEPIEHRPLVGSERQPARGAIGRGPTEATQKLQVSVRLPAELHPLVAGVFGLDNWPQARPLNSRVRAADSRPSQSVTGHRRLYAAWKGMWDDQGIYWATFEGNTWSPQHIISGVGTSPDLLVGAG